MFEKLLSLLPYNPGLLHQMSFYSRRMREEAAIRRTGLIFLVLAFMVQFFAVLSPPVITSAYSTNDLIDGGISSAADAESKCTNNSKNYQDIMESFGVTCADIGNASTVQLSSAADNGKLYSFGWLPQGQTNQNTHRATNETPYSIINNTQDIYGRLLHSWDSNANTTYKALRVTNSSGQVFYILYTCGNLVTIGVPQQVARCAYNSSILSTSSKCIKACQYDTSIPTSSSQCFKACQYDKSIASTSAQCVQPCQYNKAVSASSSQCYLKCTYNSAIPSNSPQCFARCPLTGLSAIPQSSPQCHASCPYNSTLIASSVQCFQPCQYNSSLSASSTACFPPCQYDSSISSSDSSCKPCAKSLSSEDTIACISVHKTASNITAGISNADGTTASPGDVITYTLYATNNGKASVDKFAFQENLSYVVDYADVVDVNGGTVDSNNVISWPSQSIAAGSTATKQITVKVKDPVPSTPVDSGDPNLYNLTMTNVYGNAVNIKVPSPPAKTVETAAATLPNTGPGAGLFVAAFLVMIGGYFYGRARLLAMESATAVKENSGGLN